MKKKIDIASTIGPFYRYIIVVCFLAFFSVSALFQKDNLSFILIAVALLSLLFFARKKHHSNATITTGAFVFFLAFSIRFIYCTYVAPHVSQISDFEATLNHAWTGVFTDEKLYYLCFPHKLLYPLLLHILHITTQNRIFLLQSILSGVVALLIFKICSFLKNPKIALPAALLYTFWPSQIVYAQITSEEHVASVLLLLVLFLTLHLKRLLDKKNIRNIRTLFLLSILIGILLGLQSLFKDWGSVYIVALALSLPYLIIKAKDRKKVALICVSFIIILLGRFVTTSSSMLLAQHVLDGVKPNTSGVVVWQFYETMDPDSNGSYNAEKAQQFRTWVIENNYDFETVNSIALNDVISRIKAQPAKTIHLLFQKIRVSYKNNGDTFFWTRIETEPTFFSKYESLWEILLFADNVYYICMVILMLLAALTSKNRIVLFFLLVILGGGLVCSFVENQPRYKTSIEPMWCIPAGYAIIYSFDALEKKYLRLKLRLSTKKSS